MALAHEPANGAEDGDSEEELEVDLFEIDQHYWTPSSPPTMLATAAPLARTAGPPPGFTKRPPRGATWPLSQPHLNCPAGGAGDWVLCAPGTACTAWRCQQCRVLRPGTQCMCIPRRTPSPEMSGGAHSTSRGRHNLNMIGDHPIAEAKLSELIDRLCLALNGQDPPGEVSLCAGRIAQHFGPQLMKVGTQRAIVAACRWMRMPAEFPDAGAASQASGCQPQKCRAWRTKLEAGLKAEEPPPQPSASGSGAGTSGGAAAGTSCTDPRCAPGERTAIDGLVEMATSSTGRVPSTPQAPPPPSAPPSPPDEFDAFDADEVIAWVQELNEPAFEVDVLSMTTRLLDTAEWEAALPPPAPSKCTSWGTGAPRREGGTISTWMATCQSHTTRSTSRQRRSCVRRRHDGRARRVAVAARSGRLTSHPAENRSAWNRPHAGANARRR